MVEVVFHVGAHKCATTTIQKGLERLSAGRSDLFYAPPVRRGNAGAPSGSEQVGELRDFVRLIGRGDEAAVQRDGVVDGLCRLIAAHGHRERVVFSDEYILGGMPGLRWSFYPRAEVAREVIDEVARRFPTRMLLQSRPTAGYLRSSHQFRARMGMTLGYAAFLDRYDLTSISWAKLGETLFDGVAYDWRVLPLEWLGAPGHSTTVAETLRFLVPDWSLADTPLESENRSNGALMRAATLVMNRAGKTFVSKPGSPLARSLEAAESEVALASDGQANALIEQALNRGGTQLGSRLVNMVRLQFEEEREPAGHLHRLLDERFAPDYADFLSRYAPGGV